jgi:hypothetical protein
LFKGACASPAGGNGAMWLVGGRIRSANKGEMGIVELEAEV